MTAVPTAVFSFVVYHVVRERRGILLTSMPFVGSHNPFNDGVSAFVERVMADAGLAHLPLGERAATAAALAEEAQVRVGLELLEAVDRWSLREFQALVNEGAADDEVAAFFRVRLPDADARAAQALERFRGECLALVRETEALSV
jgi:hypothetical protein